MHFIVLLDNAFSISIFGPRDRKDISTAANRYEQCIPGCYYFYYNVAVHENINFISNKFTLGHHSSPWSYLYPTKNLLCSCVKGSIDLLAVLINISKVSIYPFRFSITYLLTYLIGHYNHLVKTTTHLLNHSCCLC